MSTARRSSYCHPGLLIALVALAILFINPVRETALEDDWAYALTVQHLLDTGTYKIHAWPTANIVFPAYWGALFAKVGGFSFSTLRISTLVLVVLGLVAFYFLAREQEFDRSEATILTLCLFSSPLFLRFSFNFMTDVPFTCLVVSALFLYSRALRSRSHVLMFAGSAAAALAVLTRQFGIILLVGLFLVWILSHDRRELSRFFLVGALVPFFALLWQVYSGIVHPNWGAQFTLAAQHRYLADVPNLLISLLWRPSVIFQYLAFFAFPLVPVAALAFVSHLVQRRPAENSSSGASSGWTPQGHMVLVGALGLYIIGCIIYAATIGVTNGNVATRMNWLMPYLPWNLGDLADMSVLARAFLTVVTVLGAILFGWVFVQRYSPPAGWRGLPPDRQLLDMVFLSLAAVNLVFFKIGDEYLLGLLPLLLIIVGSHLKRWVSGLRHAVAMVSIVVLIVSSVWVRGIVAQAEASWTAGELIRSTGIKPDEIFVSWNWNSYYGAFDLYLNGLGNEPVVENMEDFFGQWLPMKNRSASFLVVEPPTTPASFVAEVVYRDGLLRQKSVYAIRGR